MTKSKNSAGSKNKQNSNKLTLQQRMEMVSTAAYFLAEKRGFENGSPEQDWFLAELQIDELSANEKN